MPVNDTDTAMARPFVSVIVPVRNAPGHIRRCLDALMQQTYPHDRFEVLVVDNGSTDETVAVIQSYAVRLLVETSMASPYPARNLGIRHAQGDIIALLDADCTPAPTWLEQGVAPLAAGTTDMLGGKVTFTFSARRTIGEMVDSLMHINVQGGIEQNQACPTANLFVRASLFHALGGFPNHVRSGGDTLWTGRATRAGYSLVYGPTVEVLKPARTLPALLKKAFRTGTGSPALFRDRGVAVPQIVQHTLRGFLPGRLSLVRRMIVSRGTPDMFHAFWPIWFVYWLARSANSLGRMKGLLYLAEVENTPIPSAKATR